MRVPAMLVLSEDSGQEERQIKSLSQVSGGINKYRFK